MARIEMIADADLKFLDNDGSICEPIKAASLWKEHPVLFLVIRRPVRMSDLILIYNIRVVLLVVNWLTNYPKRLNYWLKPMASILLLY